MIWIGPHVFMERHAAEALTSHLVPTASMPPFATSSGFISSSITLRDQQRLHSSTSMPPAHDALSVPEILEEIILNLPLRQIVRLRIVCREFRRIINGTTSIQRALFLQPSSTEALVWSRGRSSDHPFFQTPGHLHPASSRGWRADGNPANPARFPILNPFFPM